MTETNLSPQNDLGDVVSNTFGEHYLFAINRNAFQSADASTVFRSFFDNSLFEENTFYLIAGTDSGLLYQYIKSQGVPKGSRYLFVDLPQVLERLVELIDPQGELAIATMDNWQELAISKMDLPDYAIQDRMVLHRSLGVVHGHFSAYLPFWRKLREEFDVLKDSYRLGLSNRPFSLRQIENLTENQNPAICLKDAFKGKTAVLLAGGPSLDELLPWVQRHRRNLLVIAVSRVSHSLIQAGIHPDICVSVDPYDINMNVSKEMLEFQNGTLLVNEYHLNANLLSSWGGKKVFLGKRYPWSTPLESENLPPSIGATVTNSAVTFAVESGVTHLILGGVDFCFGQAGHTHASGSAEHSLGPRPMHGDKRVETNAGMMADSIHAFLNSARSMDLQAQDALTRGCQVINPAADAMRLPHVEHLSLDAIQVEPLERPAWEIITAKLATDDGKTRIRFYKEVLGELDRVLAELRTIKALSSDALDYNRKLFDRRTQGTRSHNNTKLNSIEKKIDGKHADIINFIKHFGIRRLIPILRQNEQQEKDLEKNSQLYFQALVDTANELMDILGDARSRILSRIEEEKEQPDVQHLLNQWRHDKQPGRAIQWGHRHADVIKQLPETQQKALHAFQDSFDDSVEELNQHYLKGIESEGKLDGMNSRAREYFQCRDEEGLLGLQASLEEHRDVDQAKHYIPLVQGYLAELRGAPSEAIEAYQSTTEGPAHIEVLMRLFELHTKNHDFESALEVLKILSGISTTYTPMYADMLQATGDVNNAVEIYTDYLLNNPDDLNSMMKLGKIYHQYESTEGVEWAMNYILGKDPDNHAAKAMLSSLDQS